MSQVKKFQSGGSLTIDGKRYEATPELIQALSSHLKSYGDTAAPLAGLTTALMNGQDVVYDSIGNTISGMSGNWTGIDDRADTKRNVGASRWRKGLQAVFNTDAHQFRNALRYLSGFTYNDKPAETPASNLTDIYGNQLWYEWTDDENGNKVLVKDAAANRGITSRIAALSDYLNMSDEAAAKKYKLGSWYDAQRMQALRDLYKAHPTDWQATIDRIAANAAKGPDALTAEDKAFLKHFNIVGGDSSSSGSVTPKLSVADKTKWTNAGYGSLIDLLGGHAHLNDDGSISLNDGESWGWNLEDLNGHNIYFNDDFYKSRYALNGDFNPFKNMTLYNNRLYALNNPTLAKILNSEGGYNSFKNSGDWKSADNIIVTRFTDAARENPGEFGRDYYSEFLSDHPEYRFTNLTGLYDVDGLKPGEQLIQLYNLDTPMENNSPYREYAPKYVVLDNKGKYVRDYDNFNGRRIRGASAQDLNAYRRVTPEMGGNATFKGRYYEDIVAKNGEPTGYRVYYNPKNPDKDMVLHMPGINAAGVGEDQDINVPPELGKILIKKFKDEDFLRRLIGNAQNKKDFQMLMSQLVQSWWRQQDNTKVGGRGWAFIPILTAFVETNRKKWKDLGFEDKELDEVLNAWKNAKNNKTAGNKATRQFNYLVTAPNTPEEKDGGTIGKYQFGGVAGGSSKVQANTAKQVNTRNTNPKNSAGIAEIGNQNWTDADTADIVALVSDLGSLATAFIPGANLASVGTGMAGSTARFYADKQRGTKGAGLNYLLNLGMDTAMAIPILGGMGKAVKIPEIVAKTLPTIVKAASVYGLGAGVVDTAKKIASGQKFTVRDVDMVVNALTAGIGLGKMGGFGKSKKTITTPDAVSLTSKDGNTTLKLTESEMSDIKDPDRLLDTLFNKAKKGNTSLTKEQFAEQFDVDSVLNIATKWKPSWNPKTWFKKQTSKSIKTSPKEQSISTKEGSFKEWWTRTGQYQREYNTQFTGKRANRTTIKAYELKRTDTDVFPTKPRVFRKKGTVTSTEIPLSQYKRSFKGEVIPGEFVQLGEGPGMVQQPGIANYTGYITKSTTTQAPWHWMPVQQLIWPFTDANNQRNQNTQPSGFVMRPLYKKGGRIVKGATGFPTLDLFKPGQINYSVDLLNPQKTNYQSFSTPTTESFNSNLNQTIQDNNTKLSGIKLGNLLRGEDTIDNRLALNTVLNNISSNPFSNKPKTKTNNNGDEQGGLNENLPLLDLNVPLNWLRAAHSMAQSDKQLQNFLSRPRYYMHAPLLNAPRFIDSGQKAAYDAAANRTRMYKPVTSDAIRNDAAIRQRQAEATNLEIQGNLAHSQEVGRYHAALDEFNNQNIIRNTEIANQNRHLDWQHDIEDVQAKNANIAEKSKFFDQAAYATQDWYNRQLGLAQQKRAREAGLDSITSLQKWYTDQISSWKTTWAGKEDTAAAQAALTSINNELRLKKQSMPDFLAEQQLVMPFMKKGGKTSRVTYSKDPYPELLLQNSKNSDRFVEKLNDSVIRLILQSKPIHVH